MIHEPCHELWLFISDMIGPAGRALADMMILRWWILNLYSGLWSGVVLGCELLRGQGFPEGLLVSRSVEIDSEAGESKTVDVPPVSASWLCVVWNVVFFSSGCQAMLHSTWNLESHRNGMAKDLDLNRMAGNTISVNVIGSLIAVLLASVLAIGPYGTRTRLHQTTHCHTPHTINHSDCVIVNSEVWSWFKSQGPGFFQVWNSGFWSSESWWINSEVLKIHRKINTGSAGISLRICITGCDMEVDAKVPQPPPKRLRSKSRSASVGWTRYTPKKGVFVGPCRIMAKASTYDSLLTAPKPKAVASPKKKGSRRKSSNSVSSPARKQLKIDQFMGCWSDWITEVGYCIAKQCKTASCLRFLKPYLMEFWLGLPRPSCCWISRHAVIANKCDAAWKKLWSAVRPRTHRFVIFRKNQKSRFFIDFSFYVILKNHSF